MIILLKSHPVSYIQRHLYKTSYAHRIMRDSAIKLQYIIIIQLEQKISMYNITQINDYMIILYSV